MRVSPINLKTLAYTLDVEGHSSAPVLARCGLPPFDALREDGDWLHVDVFDQMMVATLEHTGDPAFGLVAGKSLALMKYGAITPLITNAPSLRAMLANVARFGRLSVERPEMELEEQGEHARIVVQPVSRHPLAMRFRVDLVTTSSTLMLRFAGAGNADIHDIELPYEPEPEHAARYAATFGARLVCNRRQAAVNFASRLLDAPMPMHDPLAYEGAMARAEALLSAMKAGSDLAEQVSQALLAALPQALSVADTAARVGLNERQLRRQLAALGTTHADLLQQCQRAKAERLMAEGRLPIKQVADELGFGSVHSFHRAFKRWFGVTPSTWKQG
ncbi:MAG: hypothetical protein RI907_3385 [Pseudomonadota bacterium]|jgi:AraC-like DNA-binding protein